MTLPEPYYADDLVTLYHGDCREGMALLELPDVTIADPPYGQTSLDWDRWPMNWLDFVTGRQLWCFGTLRMFMEHAGEFGSWRLAQDVVWEKHNGSGFHADRFRRVHEQVAHFYRGGWEDLYRAPVMTMDATKRTTRRKGRPLHTGDIKPSFHVSTDGGPRLMRSVIQARSTHGYAQNETQKPEAIVLPLLRYSCPPGGLVLDPFSGSGTVLAVARSLGMRAVGFEVREEQCEVAANRCRQEVLGLAG